MSKAPQRFNWKTKGKANEAAVIRGPFYRFTMLTDRLVRIEFDPSGRFEDRASSQFFYREQPVPNFFQSIDENNILSVETEYILLTYKLGAEFTRDTLQIRLKNAPGSIWHYGEDPQQLFGTTSTLDGIDGAIELQKGRHFGN